MYMLSMRTDVSYIMVFPVIMLEVLVERRPLFPETKNKSTSQVEAFPGNNVMEGVIIESRDVCWCPDLVFQFFFQLYFDCIFVNF